MNFIIFMVKELSEYLLYLDENQEEYLKYLGNPRGLPQVHR